MSLKVQKAKKGQLTANRNDPRDFQRKWIIYNLTTKNTYQLGIPVKIPKNYSNLLLVWHSTYTSEMSSTFDDDMN